MPAGRPSDYSLEIADKICQLIASPMSLSKACKPDDMPCMSTVFKWLREHPEFSQKYANACEERTEAQAEELLDIADEARNDFMEQQEDGGGISYKLNGEAINRSRLRVDTRKWLMSKMKPKKYGDKVHTEISGPNGGPVTLEGLIAAAGAAVNEPDKS